VHKNSAYIMKFLVFCNNPVSVNMLLLTHVLYCATVAVHGNHFILCAFSSSDTSPQIQWFWTVKPSLSLNNQTEWNRLRNRGTPGWKTWAYIMKYQIPFTACITDIRPPAHRKAMHKKVPKKLIFDLMSECRNLSIKAIAEIMLTFFVWCTGLLKLVAVHCNTSMCNILFFVTSE